MNDFKLVSTCYPVKDTIRIEQESQTALPIVKWACDTAGSHEVKCKDMEEAHKLVQDLQEAAKKSPLYGEIRIGFAEQVSQSPCRFRKFVNPIIGHVCKKEPKAAENLVIIDCDCEGREPPKEE